MELRDIQTFLIIAETGKMNLSAQIMHYSQPTLTARINKLEDELGVKLFKRNSRNITLTKYGKVLLPYAYEINKTTEKVMHELTSLRNENSMKLVIATSFFASFYELPDIVAQYKKKYPNVYLDIRTMKGRDVVEHVENGEVTLGICRKHVTKTDINMTMIRHEDIKLCTLPDSPLANRREIYMADLTSIPMLGNSINGYWKVVEECFEDAGLNMNIDMTLDNVETIKQFILRGNGVSFLPASAVKNEVARGMLTTKSVEDMELRHDIYIYYQAKDQLDQCALDFLDMLQKTDGQS